jgi:hypothetical protein
MEMVDDRNSSMFNEPVYLQRLGKLSISAITHPCPPTSLYLQQGGMLVNPNSSKNLRLPIELNLQPDDLKKHWDTLDAVADKKIL